LKKNYAEKCMMERGAKNQGVWGGNKNERGKRQMRKTKGTNNVPRKNFQTQSVKHIPTTPDA
jgi:hypothetical protein